MLWTLFLILIVMWVLGMVSAYTMGWVHLHLADIGSHSCGDTADQWTSSALKDRQQVEERWDFPGPLQMI
jgi:hypothetical protein